MVREDDIDGDNGVADSASSRGQAPARSHGAKPAADVVPEVAAMVPLCWPFPPGSQNHTDKAVKLKPYVPPKRRSLNQY